MEQGSVYRFSLKGPPKLCTSVEYGMRRTRQGIVRRVKLEQVVGRFISTVKSSYDRHPSNWADRSGTTTAPCGRTKSRWTRPGLPEWRSKRVIHPTTRSSSTKFLRHEKCGAVGRKTPGKVVLRFLIVASQRILAVVQECATFRCLPQIAKY